MLQSCLDRLRCRRFPSQDFSWAPGSFESRRECAIEVRDADVVDRLHEVTHADWKNSHPLDLTDEGLLAELEDLDENASKDLAFDVRNGKHKKP